ncbi:MAG TPA: type III pantothenate kinase [Pyrinomonadaceae bacterium]|nr:type III pantothenate kinase [Pyrinomonadaceae bacterium]
MLLAIDIGNTAIKCGVFDGDILISKFVVKTKDYDADELHALIAHHLDPVPKNAIVSSVVPELSATVAQVLTTTGCEARLITSKDDLGLTRSFSGETIGTDRLVNSFAAAELHGSPCIVISFGTATTIDVVNKDREHLGGLIAPGPKANAKALELITSQLPEVEIVEPESIVNTTTEGAIQAGIFYSQIGLVETAVRHVKREIGDDAKVVATGGFASMFAAKCGVIDVVEPDLTLLGLKMLYSLGANGQK